MAKATPGLPSSSRMKMPMAAAKPAMKGAMKGMVKKVTKKK